MRKLLCLCAFLIALVTTNKSTAQQQLAFSFGETPNTLMLNPGAETNFKYHYGIPVLSNFNLNVGFTGFELTELFLDDGLGFDGKVRAVLANLDQDDYINFDTRIDVLNGGYRYDNRTYLSFGFYNEVNFMMYIPKDIADLFYLGNAGFIDRTFSLSQLTMKADVIGVLHAGISRKVNRRLNIGARVKIYSSSFNVETNHNSGTFTTFENNTNISRQSLNNVNVRIQTAGLLDQNDEFNGSNLLSNTFLSGNLGLGFDFGMTYHFTPQLEFTGSIVDLGFIRHSKNTRIFSAEGDYTFDGINFEYDPDNPRDYWQELEDDFDAKVPTQETQEAYTTWRPTRLNAALKYSFGEIRSKVCYADTYKQYYYNAIGFQVHSIIRPRGPQFSFTSFFETSLTEKIHTKLTHTFNEYSATILGSGLTFQWGKVNVFGLVDNFLGVRDILSANNLTVNFGVNMVID